MDIHLENLNYRFKKKPLLVGGKAMEYYGLRKAGDDIDLVVSEEDIIELIRLYPQKLKDLWGDLGVCPDHFEIWKTICLFDYDFYREGAIEKEEFLIVSKEKLLFMKALGMKVEKYMKDMQLVTESILDDQWKTYDKENKKNKKLLSTISDVTFIQKKG